MLAPGTGFEPATNWLTANCSTTELPRNITILVRDTTRLYLLIWLKVKVLRGIIRSLCKRWYLHKEVGLSQPAEPRFSYTLGAEVGPIITGKKLRSRNIRARQILVRPGRNLSEKYWVVTKVEDVKDLDLVGELLIYVKPRPPLNEHETFVTVESGIRSSVQGSRNIALRSQLETERSATVVEVRQRLLDDWLRLLQDARSETGLLELVASDMQLCRTFLRKDARERIENSVGFRDSLARYNPSANAARLTAAIARLRLQLEYDALSEKSLRYRYLNCTTVAETIAADIWDLQVMLSSVQVGRKSTPAFMKEAAKRLDRLGIKPYFWAKIWIQRHKLTHKENVRAAEMLVEALLAEQQLGEIDMLLSELKHAEKDQQRLLLRIITMTLASVEYHSRDYANFFSDVARMVRRNLGLSRSKPRAEYTKKVEEIQKHIRYRPQTPDSPWILSDAFLLS